MKRALPILLLAGLLAGGCRSLSVAGRAESQAPLPRVDYLPGDVVVTRSASHLSSLLASHPDYQGPYSHGGLIARDADGRLCLLHIQGSGVAITPLEKRLPHYAGYAVYRHRDVDADHNPLLPVIAGFVQEKRPEVGSAFDSDDTSATVHYSCLELVDAIYTEAGLDPPFPHAVNDAVKAWLAWYDRRPGPSPADFPCANAVLGQPAFRLVAQWRNPLIAQLYLDTDQQIARLTVNRLFAGYDFGRPAIGSRAMITVYHGCGCIGDREQRLYLIRAQYVALAERVWQGIDAANRCHRLPASPADREAVVARLFDAVAGDYLILPPAARPRRLR